MKKNIFYILIYFLMCIMVPFFITWIMSGLPKETKKEAAVSVSNPSEVTQAETEQVCKVTYTAKKIKTILKSKYDDIQFESSLEGSFQIVSRNPDGNVVEIMAGNITISGSEFAELLSLPSTNFVISYNDENIIFTINSFEIS